MQPVGEWKVFPHQRKGRMGFNISSWTPLINYAGLFWCLCSFLGKFYYFFNWHLHFFSLLQYIFSRRSRSHSCQSKCNCWRTQCCVTDSQGYWGSWGTFSIPLIAYWFALILVCYKIICCSEDVQWPFLFRLKFSYSLLMHYIDAR